MTVHEAGGEVSASVAETNRIRAILGLKPLDGTGAQAPAPAVPAGGGGGAAGAQQDGKDVAEPLSNFGPQLIPAPIPPASSSSSSAPATATGAEAVLALTLDRYTAARPSWR